jgi:hypothetical protein
MWELAQKLELGTHLLFIFILEAALPAGILMYSSEQRNINTS